MNGKNGFSAIKHVANKNPYPTDAFLTEICCKKDGYSLSCMKENDLDILMLVQVPGLPVPTVCWYMQLGAYRSLPLLM